MTMMLEERTAAPECNRPRRTQRVLVVDDDPALRLFLREALSRLGYEADIAGCVQDGQELLRQRRYSLVLCDYEMPGGTGLDMLDHVCSVHPGLPFILLTGHDDNPLAREAISQGAADFLSKPFEVRQLARMIEQCWARQARDHQRTAELTREVLAGTIRALVAAVDAKDPHTAMHSERVSRLSLTLGQALSLPEDQLQVLEFAALLHDVGKIAIPEAVLLKPGSLTPEEWELFKSHPVRSAEIVGQVGPLAEVATIVRHHHERIDGNGYPDGLSADAIPYFSRVITIADAYEALTSDRSYRRAMSSAVARQIICENMGTQFDLHLSEVFLSIECLP